MKVGETRVIVRLHGPTGSTELEMLVDTGSTLTKIPMSVARRIGLVVKQSAKVKLADGSLKDRGLSQAEIELGGKRMSMPLLIGPDGEEALLGLTTLELFELKVNPTEQRLEPSRWIEYTALS